MPAGEASRDSAVSADYHAGDQGGGTALMEIAATVGVPLENSPHAPKPANPRIPWEACHPVWFTGSITLTAGAGTLQNANLYGPELPYWWDLRSLRIWGFTAGSVTVFRNLTTGEQLGVAPTAGELTWSAQEFLAPQDSMAFVAAGITGSVFLSGWAVEIASAWLPEYLM